LSAPVRHASLQELLSTISNTLFNRNFLVLTLSGIVAGIGTGLVGGLTDYFNTFFWELSANQISVITGAVGLAPFVAVILAPFLAKKLGKKAALIWTFSLSLFAGIMPVSLRLINFLPANGSPFILPLLAADAFVAVVLVVAGLIVITSMMADIVEQVQTKTGRRSEGLLFSADTMLKQIVTGVGAMGTGLVLQYVRFPEHAVPGHVPVAVLNKLALVYLPINASTSIVAIALISFFSINRADHQANLDTIARERSVGPSA
jgi:Na+/melibiose symporter-like transporter